MNEGLKARINIFLFGMLSGVMLAAAFTYVFAIPANSNYWRMEIWQRGGAAWTMDRNGHSAWKWIVEPIPDTPRQKRISVPTPYTDARSEQF
jgi:hypothetical protein